MRRLPVYLVLDTSGSMAGTAISAVEKGVALLGTTLRQDPQALESVWISVITFDAEARQVTPLTDLIDFQPPRLTAGGLTALGSALTLVADCIIREVVRTTTDRKGDWKPLVFLMTDGAPTDDWQAGLTALNQVKTGLVVACAAGPEARTDVLQQITPTVVSLDTATSETIQAYFKWISASIATTSRKVDLTKKEVTGAGELPPPPPQLTLVP